MCNESCCAWLPPRLNDVGGTGPYHKRQNINQSTLNNHNVYKLYKSILNRSLKPAEREYCDKLFDGNKNNLRRLSRISLIKTLEPIC